MAKGGWATAIAIAVGAGLARRQPAHQHGVLVPPPPARSGRSSGRTSATSSASGCRSATRVVKPALAGGPPVTATPPTAVAGRAHAGHRSAAGRAIPGDGLRWYGPAGRRDSRADGLHAHGLRQARREVEGAGRRLRRHAAATATRPRSSRARRRARTPRPRPPDAGRRARRARRARGSPARCGSASSAHTGPPTTSSDLAGQDHEGPGGFPHYYERTKAARRNPEVRRRAQRRGGRLPGRLHGGYVAAPGYSNHQDGLALDLGTRKGPGRLIKLYEGSWFHNWLKENARHHDFEPLKSEAWHWAYRPRGGTRSATGESEVVGVRVVGVRVVVRVGGRADGDQGRTNGGGEDPAAGPAPGPRPDLILRWNDMASVPSEIDVVVHLHGYSWATMTLPKHMEVWSGWTSPPSTEPAGTGRITADADGPAARPLHRREGREDLPLHVPRADDQGRAELVGEDRPGSSSPSARAA